MSPSNTPALTAGKKLGPGYVQDQLQNMQQLNTMLQMLRSVAYNAGVQSIPDSVDTPLTFDTNSIDIGTPQLHSITVNPTRFTAQVTGLYLAVGQLLFDSALGGNIRQIAVSTNGGFGAFPFSIVRTTPSAVDTCIQVTALLQLVAGSYIEFTALQDSGGPLTTIAGLTFGSLVLLSRL